MAHGEDEVVGNVGPGTIGSEQLEAQLRSEIGHSLASPIRGIAILADLLHEALTSNALDRGTLCEISEQLTTLAAEASQRLSDCSTARGA